MSNEIQKTQKSAKEIFAQANIKQRFDELLGKKAQGFISSVMLTVNNNKLLSNADPVTILNASIVAASLDLPINPNLGFSWIVPYKGAAQFQMGWKGFVQLALRTGQYKSINATEVYENQFIKFNRLTEELDADFSVVGEGNVVGYVGYMKLNNGFEKTVYWSREEIIKHASKYSQTYGKMGNYGKLVHSPWNDESQFDAMALKTVIKNMLSKWGIMSIEMQTAQVSDQAVIKEENNFEYVDNQYEDIDIEQKKEEMKEGDKPKVVLP